MPILDIEIVGEPTDAPADLALRLAEAAGQVLASRPMGTWVKLRWLPAERYAENGGGPPGGVLPVFVRLLTARNPPAGVGAREARDLTQAIAQACERPAENVHICYQAPAAGRVAFGGQLVPEGS